MKKNKTRQNASVKSNTDYRVSRVVVTGMSAITPVGNTVHDTWDALKAGRSGVAPITLLDPVRYPCKIAGEVKDFHPEDLIPRKKLRHMAYSSKMAVVAAGQALEDSGLDLEKIDLDRVGVVIGTAGGSSVEEAEQATRQLISGKSRKLSPFQVLRFWPNLPSFFIAQSHNLRGYSSTVCTACAASTQAIGDAAKLIQSGSAEIIVTGGTERLLSETTFAGFTAMRALPTSYNDAPEKAMRPFDANREGFIPSMGCAILVLENLDHALARGAHIYAEILGRGVSNDAYHMIVPDPDGSGAALAIRRALEDAHISIDGVDYINAHGTATPLGDLSETNAIKSIFGERAYKIPISSTKSMIGHMMGAAGSVEAVACIKTIEEGIIHPTINLDTPDPECDLDYVPNQARETTVDVAISNSFGLGGQNACLVIGKYK